MDEFDACLQLLPTRLQIEIAGLRHLMHARNPCRACRTAREAVQLAFDAAYLGDLAACELMIAQARAALTCDHEGSRRKESQRSAIRGQVDRWAHTGPIVAATDASWKRPHGGIGFVASDGRWGLRCRTTGPLDPSGPAKVLIDELRAVEFLLSDLLPETDQVTVLVDCAEALGFLNDWRAGRTALLPCGYSLRPRHRGRPPTLVRLAERAAAFPGLTFVKVKAHSGHLLNEAADSLAKIARRKATEAFDVRHRADSLVAAFLQAWHEPTTLAA